MGQEKLVSVIIPTHKRAKYLTRAIDSVLNQTYKNVEIIVVDDNEPNSDYRLETNKIMEKYKDFNNVIYLMHKKNKGGSAARNTGIKHSKGEYIMFLDDDDEFYPEKIEAQVNCLNNLDTSWGVCYTNFVRKKNGVITFYGAENREGYLLREVLMRNLFVHAGSNLMIRKSVIEEVNGFDESFVRNQDIEFLSRILLNYKIAYVDTLGLIVHSDDRQKISKSYEEITEYYLKKLNPIIQKLPADDQTKLYQMIDLQYFRNYLTSKGKRTKAIKLLFSRSLPISLIIRYMFHLINRKVRKQAYGFKI